MNPLKFRAWDGNKFVNVNELEIITDKNSVGGVVGYNVNGHLGIPVNYLQQYTGMKDTNGVEIYEGDFLCEKYTDEMAANGSGASIGVVYFAAGTFMIDGDRPMYDHVESTSPDILQDYLVIGNIFTNPELLTQ